MTLLCDLPWLQVVVESANSMTARITSVCSILKVAPEPDALVNAVEGCRSSHVVVLPPNVSPIPDPNTLSLDPVLVNVQRVLIWPSLNEMTGEADPAHGLRFVPLHLLREHPDLFIQEWPSLSAISPLVIPEYAGTWTCGSSAEIAFRAGFFSVQSASPKAAELSASLGSDRPNGVWWGLGACHGLLGEKFDIAWSAEFTLQSSIEAQHLRWHELARRIRVELGLDVRPLDSDAAAVLRLLRGNRVSAPLWDEFVVQLRQLGPSAERLAEAYALARETIWGQDDEQEFRPAS